ncbi:hypothetical protein VNI00_005701 [Paramarasmius palmivorus]|uniref:Uncharacterized protein n=1 Tax=Paramarasmius palmivorus TaxID=297713 RepID=A0AAW0DD61_9AGAR
MSSISFPGHPSHSLHDSQYSFASESIEITPSRSTSHSGFQMNPLSSHPPARTPRTSVASSHFTSVSASVYDTMDDVGERQVEAEVERDQDVDEDDEEEVPEEEVAKASIRKEDVWREMVRTSEGRDKAFKLIQYTIRVYLFFHTKLSSSFLRGVLTRPWIKELVKRMTSTMSGLSFTRKMLLLFNWLTPLTLITAQQNSSITPDYTSKHPSTSSKPTQKPFLESLLTAPPPLLLDLVNALADDLYALSLLGLLSKRSGERASRFADWCWWLSTIAGLIENEVERGVIGGLRAEGGVFVSFCGLS